MILLLLLPPPMQGWRHVHAGCVCCHPQAEGMLLARSLAPSLAHSLHASLSYSHMHWLARSFAPWLPHSFPHYTFTRPFTHSPVQFPSLAKAPALPLALSMTNHLTLSVLCGGVQQRMHVLSGDRGEKRRHRFGLTESPSPYGIQACAAGTTLRWRSSFHVHVESL